MSAQGDTWTRARGRHAEEVFYGPSDAHIKAEVFHEERWEDPITHVRLLMLHGQFRVSSDERIPDAGEIEQPDRLALVLSVRTRGDEEHAMLAQALRWVAAELETEGREPLPPDATSSNARGLSEMTTGEAEAWRAGRAEGYAVGVRDAMALAERSVTRARENMEKASPEMVLYYEGAADGAEAIAGSLCLWVDCDD